jgi:hypothetical protein
VKIDSYINGGHRMGSTPMMAFVIANNSDCAYDVPVGEVMYVYKRNDELHMNELQMSRHAYKHALEHGIPRGGQSSK